MYIMIRLAEDKIAYVEVKKTNLLLDERHLTINIDELAEAPFSYIRDTYRALFIPIVEWDGEIKTIDLFAELAKTRVMVGNDYRLRTILNLLKLDKITYYPEIKDIVKGSSKWHVNPHDTFELKAVKPGYHPDHDVPIEERTDLLFEERYLYPEEHNMVWCIGEYFVFSKYIDGNYFIPNGRILISGFEQPHLFSCLDLSGLDCHRPIAMKGNHQIEDDSLVLNLPDQNYDGVLIFIAGRLLLEIKDTHDITISSNKIRIPLSKITLGVTHIGNWMENFKIEELSNDVLFNHETSFFIPFKNDVYAEYSLVPTEYNKDNHITTKGLLPYNGEMIIDSDGEIVPFLTEALPNTEEKEYVIETHFVRKKNALTTTDYLSNQGNWENIADAIKRVGAGVYYRPKTDNLRFVKLMSFRGIDFG